MVSGKATFRCCNGHEWRTRCLKVAEGEGCPQCGIGYREPEEIWQAAELGYLCLLIHPDKPGFIKIGLTYRTLEQCYEENTWEDWEVHRYRYVVEPVLAESLIWELLGCPLPHDREPINIDLSIAEQAFRDLIYRMRHEIALAERKKEDVQKGDTVPISQCHYEPDPSETGEALLLGRKVSHPMFGIGQVISVEGTGPDARITVYFPKGGEKRLVAKYANLQLVG